MKILQWITNLFEDKSYQVNVEYYVASKNPSNSAEVEYWIREYDQKRSAQGWAV